MLHVGNQNIKLWYNCGNQREVSIHDLYIDVETQKLSDEVGGWHNIYLMKLAIAVT